MANFDIAIQKTLGHEGLLSNDPDDSGGLTKYGISQRAYPNEDIANLTIDRAKFIYKRDYWDSAKLDSIVSQKIAESIFDFAVNAGVETSVRFAQEVVGTDADGIVGKNTIYAINIFNERLFMAEFRLKKIERYVGIIDKKPTQIKYLKGWIKRALL